MIFETRRENVANLLELGYNLLVSLVLLEKRIDKLSNVEAERALECTVLGADVFLLVHTVDLNVIVTSEDHVFMLVNAFLDVGPLNLFSLAHLDMGADEVGVRVLGDEVEQL